MKVNGMAGDQISNLTLSSVHRFMLHILKAGESWTPSRELAGIRRDLKKYKNLDVIVYCIFFLFDSLRPSQQFFSHIGRGLPELNQY